MNRVTELYSDLSDVLAGHAMTDIMAVLTALTATVLSTSMREDQTIDTAMALFKKQVQRHMDSLRQMQ